MKITKDGQTGFRETVLQVPDIIILDLVMPGEIDGFGALKEIRNNENITKTEVDLKDITKIIDQYLQ